MRNLLPKTPNLVLDFNAKGGIAPRTPTAPPSAPTTPPTPTSTPTAQSTVQPVKQPSQAQAVPEQTIPPQLAAELLALRTDNLRLNTENQGLRARIVELEAKLGRFHLLEPT